MVFQQEAMVNLQSIPVCKSYTASTENPLWFHIVDLIADNSWIEIKYQFEYV